MDGSQTTEDSVFLFAITCLCCFALLLYEGVLSHGWGPGRHEKKSARHGNVPSPPYARPAGFTGTQRITVCADTNASRGEGPPKLVILTGIAMAQAAEACLRFP